MLVDSNAMFCCGAGGCCDGCSTFGPVSRSLPPQNSPLLPATTTAKEEHPGFRSSVNATKSASRRSACRDGLFELSMCAARLSCLGECPDNISRSSPGSLIVGASPGGPRYCQPRQSTGPLLLLRMPEHAAYKIDHELCGSALNGRESTSGWSRQRRTWRSVAKVKSIADGAPRILPPYLELGRCRRHTPARQTRLGASGSQRSKLHDFLEVMPRSNQLCSRFNVVEEGGDGLLPVEVAARTS